jgi:hypothetical protein
MAKQPLLTISDRGRRGILVCLVSPNRQHILRRRLWKSATCALLDARRHIARGARVPFPNAVRDLEHEAIAEHEARIVQVAD